VSQEQLVSGLIYYIVFLFSTTVHEAARDGTRNDAVVACFPAAAAGVLSRALVYSAAMSAARHLSVVGQRQAAEGWLTTFWRRS